MCLYEVGTGLSVLINQGVLVSGCPLRKVPVCSMQSRNLHNPGIVQRILRIQIMLSNLIGFFHTTHVALPQGHVCVRVCASIIDTANKHTHEPHSNYTCAYLVAFYSIKYLVTS